MTSRGWEMLGAPDPCFAWDGTSAATSLPGDPTGHEGAFAGLAHRDGATVVARDPLGLGKLFWAPADEGIEVAARPSQLTERGHPLEACAAFPPNTVVAYRADEPEPVVRPVVAAEPAPARPCETVETLARAIRDEVERYVEAVLAQRPGPAVVCLSGGLDSTSVAALVREHRDDAIAVTFDLAMGAGRRRSDDLAAAAQAARHLGLPLAPAIHARDALLDLLDLVLLAGIDWRDFNVHAGLVNAGLAVSIPGIAGVAPEEVTVFTGDLVNELVADYHDEAYKGRTYYRLPRLSPGALRDALVSGLQTSHREIGVFGALGLTVVQPYAAARRSFLRLPPEALDPGDGKRVLYQAMFGERLPPSSYERPKTRAQVGSAGPDSDAGVLGACVDAGIDGRWLERRFAQLHNVTDPSVLRRFLRAGRYRTAIP